MISARRLIPNSPGHGFGPFPGQERVGNEAVVSTWLVAGVQNLAKQLVFGVTRSDFAVRCGGIMTPYDRNHLVASRLTRRSNGRALEESRPNKPCHATRNRPAIAHQPQSLARVRA
jgi:hypothetical protein